MRKTKISRETEETTVNVELVLDGSGDTEVETGIEFFDHLLESFTKHGRFNLKVTSVGDFEHHIAEDTMIVLGQAVEEALGDKKGIRRMADATVPMDDSLALVAIDLGGRVYTNIDVDFEKEKLNGLNSDLFVHLIETFAGNAECNLHVDLLRGSNDHHKAEAIFKGFGIALSKAVEQIGEDVPSTKGMV